MSIQSEIDRIENNIAATYAELEEQGADMPSLLNSDNLAATAATTKTVKYIAQSLTAAQQAQARNNIGAAAHYYGVCGTAAATAAKTVTVDDGFALTAGAQVTVKFTYANSVASPTLNVNGTGAKPIYRYGTTVASTGTTTTGWVAGAIQTFTYDGTGWIRDYWSNTTYSNASLGQGYGTCTTAAATVAKVVTLSSYALTAGGMVAVKFTNDVPANATMNINSKGAKAIYYRGAKIAAGVIKAGDTATFIYSTYYHLISIDRGNGAVTVKDYGAKGDNSTDDTAAFQNALASERVVYVPGGSYKLSGGLTIGDNCRLELAQDAVLYFTQTSGNCISMKMGANIKGNHATVSVPYTFSGNVIYVYTQLDSDVTAVPPFTAWDPQWKTARYITGLNIVKPNSNGNYASDDGTCYGTAVYISAENDSSSSTDSSFIWGLDFSGLRIAGGFKYGIRAYNVGDGTVAYNHDMHIEALIDACEIGVSVENCRNAYLSASVQPRAAANGTVYAKHGIYLNNSANADMSSARIWDWSSGNSLYQYKNQYQHLAMIGACAGAVLSDLAYVTSSIDIRERIYTDTPSNLDSLTVLQEPITRWFKPIDNEPYFYNGSEDKKLMLREELDEVMQVSKYANFVDKLAVASDGSGNIYNGVGYSVRSGYWSGSDYKSFTTSSYYDSTGYIPCKKGDVIDAANMSLEGSRGDGLCGIFLFNSSFTLTQAVTCALNSSGVCTLLENGSWHVGYAAKENGFQLTINSVVANDSVAYMKMSLRNDGAAGGIGVNPAVAVNETVSYSMAGTLADGISVNGANIILQSSNGSKRFKLAVNDSGTLSAVQI